MFSDCSIISDLLTFNGLKIIFEMSSSQHFFDDYMINSDFQKSLCII